ncbi:hypothetical protein [Desulfatitalea alkaliphila]|uniref:Uncharacterized protein n=1 Tax=Desulfatitalea alkaliphila TaxID=2929485 RepID=A0AA41UHX4_9BACT|nr:hypothetical protein [Desulfatitalea alkaliphila]MCJ8500115.1 hypothetical protein [Desulfatitalea alkaliphila]
MRHCRSNFAHGGRRRPADHHDRIAIYYADQHIVDSNRSDGKAATLP